MAGGRDGIPEAPAAGRTGPAQAQSSQASSSQPAFAISPPKIELPKGGGAIRGIGEKFAANPVTGTGSMSIPIAVSPGRGGFGPQLALTYDSGAGNGPFGLGWSLGLPSITRKTDKGLPLYRDAEDSDTFILAGAEDLVRFLNENGTVPDDEEVRVYGATYRIRRYRPRVEGLFALIERWSHTTDRSRVFWRTISRNNITTWFGRTERSRIADPDDPARIFQWLISETYDDRGNVAVYTYQGEDGSGVVTSSSWEANRLIAQRQANKYLKQIRYGNLTPYVPKLTRTGRWEEPSTERDDWMFEVVFDYGDHRVASPLRDPDGAWSPRADSFSTHRAGFEIRTYRLCRRVLMFHHFPAVPALGITEAPEVGPNCLVRSTDFDYSEPTKVEDPPAPEPKKLADPLTRGYAVLASVTQRSYQRPSSAATSYESRQLPPVAFTYSPIEVDPTIRFIAREELENLPVGTQGSGYQWVDLDGEGLSGVLSEQGGAWHYKANLGDGRFGPSRVVAPQPAMAALASGRQQLMDLAGDGEIDLVDFSGPTPGFHERDRDDGWRRHVPFASLPNIDWNDRNLRFVDLTGDGHADALLTEDQVFTWYPSLDERGFAASRRTLQPRDEEAGPRVVFADQLQTVFLADMCGDGLTDIVRIRNGEVCYWPNLGYGLFGRKVTMGNAPRFDSPDLFDPQRLRLTDIDGSGPTDLIYLGRSGAQLYFNRSGNSLSDACLIDLPLATENLAAVQAADLLGNGTACLVWNSHLPGDTHSPVRYVRLMGAGKANESDLQPESDDEWRKHAKPHLLIRVDNNLGGTTHIEYTPSTRFYLDDKLAGTPWVTRLPFPVHCVSKVTVRDRWRGTAFSSTYSYHHGYFDGVEREFRGFGRVEQIDVEHYGRFRSGNKSSPYVTDDLTLYQPPVHTITWYHTGASLDRRRILSQFAEEYFPQRFAARLAKEANPFVERALPDPELPANLTADEWREALRACKGMLLRQEIYELDVDDLALDPPRRTPVRLFSVATHNCRIRRLQPRATNRHAAFLVTESEALTYHHELALTDQKQPITALKPDPRIAHTLNLRHDDYGNPQQTVAVGYRRWRPADYDWLPRPDLARDVQSEQHIAYTETRYTGDAIRKAGSGAAIDATRHYRLPLPCEVRTYELNGIRMAQAHYYTPTDFAPLALSDHYAPQATPARPVTPKPYHQPTSSTSEQKRLVEHVRSLYYDDASDTAEPKVKLDFTELGPRGFKFEDYKLALTGELLDAVFGTADSADPFADKLDWEYESDLAARSLLDDAKVSGYVAGETLDATFTKQYWMRSGVARFKREADKRFYVSEIYEDPFDNRTELAYDSRVLFVKSMTDPAANVTEVLRFDHRVLAPAELVDINGNRTEAAFDVRGLVVAVAAKGKRVNGVWEGDHLDGWTFEDANPAAAAVAAFCLTSDYNDAMEQQARAWLGTASSARFAASARFVYHFGEDYVDGKAVWLAHMAGACSFAREIHAGQPGGATSAFQIALECSDGGGAVLMKKVRAEPDPDSLLIDPPARWLVNGLTVLNNKGKPVKQYEPAFSAEFGCEVPQANGVCTAMYYDAPGRLVRTEFPDETISRVVFSPWDTESWDQNDTVEESGWLARNERNAIAVSEALTRGLDGLVEAKPDERAGWLARQHANTPARTILDSLGREVIAVAHNRVEDARGPHTFDGKQWKDDYYVTYSKLDAEGKPLWIRDARDNLVMQYLTPPKPTRFAAQSHERVPYRIDAATRERLYSAPSYDIAGNLLYQHSMDAGDRWMLMDAAGAPLLAWDFNERQDDGGAWIQEHRLYRTEYEKLHRPTANWLRTWSRPKPSSTGASAVFQLGDPLMLERFEYQDGVVADALNLNGQLTRHYDPSGLVETVRRDFKGNVQEIRRQLVRDPKAFQVDWNPLTPSKLEAEAYMQITEHDALGRMTVLHNWHRAGQPFAVYTPQYNARGLLQSEALRLRETSTTKGREVEAIKDIHYNAKGQKTLLRLGNGTVTRYTYDDETFRLVHLYTQRGRAQFAGDCSSNPNVAQPPRPCGVQNLHYTFDPVGNITHIHDDAQQTIYFKNEKVEPSNDYSYDALYRLVEASGREQFGVAGSPPVPEGKWLPGPIPNPGPKDGTLRRYRQRYQYDQVGNFVFMRHVAQGGDWVRYYATAPDSNRLLRTWEHSADWNSNTAKEKVEYGFDPHGSMLNLRASPPQFNLHWDHSDMIRHIWLGGGGNAWYQYDSGKQRTRKYIERKPTATEPTVKEERIYLGGFELYRRYTNDPDDPVEEIESHHLFEGEQRVLLVDDVLKAKPSRQPGPSGLSLDVKTVLRYQYGNHLGSVGVELDEDARVISHEEFHPYGTSAYRMMNSALRAPPKRYRYTGMERDEETGLSSHGARLYAAFIGRWISFDAAPGAPGLNRYLTFYASPSVHSDVTGRTPPIVTVGGAPTPMPPVNPVPPIINPSSGAGALATGPQLPTGGVGATATGVQTSAVVTEATAPLTATELTATGGALGGFALGAALLLMIPAVLIGFPVLGFQHVEEKAERQKAEGAAGHLKYLQSLPEAEQSWLSEADKALLSAAQPAKAKEGELSLPPPPGGTRRELPGARPGEERELPAARKEQQTLPGVREGEEALPGERSGDTPALFGAGALKGLTKQQVHELYLKELQKFGEQNVKILPSGEIIHRHHLLPQEFKERFEAEGLDIEQFTVWLEESVHLNHYHGGAKNGGLWNETWKEFFEKNPNASASDILDQLERMNNQWQTSKYKL